MKNSLTFSDVALAAQRVGPHTHFTPVLTSELIDQAAVATIFFKCENLQKSGSFKIRGAINAVSQLSAKQLKQGVVTHSSGNHAAALALAARIFGATAHIVMPSNSSAIKKAAVKSYGGKIVECEPTLEARHCVCEEVRQKTDAILIPPFDHPHIIAGQGTCAMEFHQQVDSLDVIVAPIGGGGLMSGTCLASSTKSDNFLVIGTEPTGADDAFQSKRKNEFVPQTDPDTIADGLRTSLGDLTWPIIRDQVDEIFCVDDQQIAETMRFFWERMKVIIEPSSAVPLAAVLANKSNPIFSGKRIGIIVSGGNVDFGNLPW